MGFTLIPECSFGSTLYGVWPTPLPVGAMPHAERVTRSYPWEERGEKEGQQETEALCGLGKHITAEAVFVIYAKRFPPVFLAFFFLYLKLAEVRRQSAILQTQTHSAEW